MVAVLGAATGAALGSVMVAVPWGGHGPGTWAGHGGGAWGGRGRLLGAVAVIQMCSWSGPNYEILPGVLCLRKKISQSISPRTLRASMCDITNFMDQQTKTESGPVSDAKRQGYDYEYLANPEEAKYHQTRRIANALERIADSLKNILPAYKTTRP